MRICGAIALSLLLVCAVSSALAQDDDQTIDEVQKIFPPYLVIVDDGQSMTTEITCNGHTTGDCAHQDWRGRAYIDYSFHSYKIENRSKMEVKIYALCPQPVSEIVPPGAQAIYYENCSYKSFTQLTRAAASAIRAKEAADEAVEARLRRARLKAYDAAACRAGTCTSVTCVCD